MRGSIRREEAYFVNASDVADLKAILTSANMLENLEDCGVCSRCV